MDGTAHTPGAGATHTLDRSRSGKASGPSATAADNPVLRLRITHITSTMSAPLPSLRPLYTPPTLPTAVPPGAFPSQLPVIRIFGTTPSLQKICANIHLCYPYFFVPFPMDSADPLRPERVIKLCQRFAVSLNHSICLAMRQNPVGATNASRAGGGTDPRHLHVLSVLLVKGVPFYGYHVGNSYFLKVSLANPSRMYVALEQLRKNVVLGREWQPHEAHLSHVLQFMCDFDLYGCGWLDLGGGTFREPLPEGDPLNSPPHGPPSIFNSLTVPQDMLYPYAMSPPKDTFTPLEIDVLPHHILNRHRLQPRSLHHDFVELLRQPLDPEEKLVPAMRELWEDERRRRLQRGQGTSESAMLPVSGGGRGRTMEELGYLLDGTEATQNKGGDWKISDELWGILEERMEAERKKKGKLSFERFAKDLAIGKEGERRTYDKWIMTTFEAVSAHWPKHVRPPRSTQRSKKSRRSRIDSSAGPMSSPARVEMMTSSPGAKAALSTPPLPSSPTAGRGKFVAQDDHFGNGGAGAPEARLDNEDEEEDDDEDEEEGEDEEEKNPFEQFAATQASQGVVVDAEVNAYAVEQELVQEDEDDEDSERQAHEQAARHQAEEGQRFRATQAATQRPQVNGDEFDEDYDYDEIPDDALDELFRRTVGGGLGSAASTPRKQRVGGSMTPTSVGSRSRDTDHRRQVRTARLLEQAGFGDLSTIMDRSSMSLSPSNPYNPQTPTKPKTPVSERPTPSSLVRNLFARPRGQSSSPIQSPSKQSPSLYPPPNTIVLPPIRRSFAGWQSPSPEDKAAPLAPAALGEEDPRDLPITPLRSKLEAIKASSEKAMSSAAQTPVPAGQVIPENASSEARTSGDKQSTSSVPRTAKRARLPSPTFHNERPSTSSAHKATPSAQSSSERAAKRVRIETSSPANEVLLAPRASGDTSTSAPSENLKSGTDSTSSLPRSKNAWQFHNPPPTSREVVESLELYELPTVVYQDPYYSNPTDVPGRAKLFAGKMFTLKGNGIDEMAEFEYSVQPFKKGWMKTRRSTKYRSDWGWEFATPPPSKKAVIAECAEQDDAERERQSLKRQVASQLQNPTQKSRYGFKFSQKKKKTRDTEREQQNMSVLCLEVFAKSRHQLLPDPEKDEVTAVFFCYQNEDESLPDTTIHPGYHAGYVVIDSAQTSGGRARLDDIPAHYVETELDLINWVIDMVKGWDPDVLAGWELHNSSWGYLAARARESFGSDLMDELSRVVSGHSAPRKDFYSATHTSTFKVSGRHILNLWRILRSEVALTQYTFENIVFHLLHQRIPHYSAPNLTALWKSKTSEHTTRVLRYFFQRVVICAELIDAAEIITKNAEFARVFGVDFASVMFRGSQFKVESFMFRIAKPESFVLVSPSKQQVGLQNAPFAVPLIAEPESKYYNHPIIVLDFQSLYPSVMIAYNICFSTCLGRVEMFKGTNKFGFTELKVADGLLELLKDYLTVTPNGMVFVKPAVRKSLLAKMLGEILDTRVMVKHAMKGARGNKSLLQLLNARQLGLKLMANVTYGYTSATYSGRMPCIEVADSIVQTGRETLEKAQELIHSRADWNAQVVYGDTDSLFIALPGRSKEQAFKIGNDIADTVTAMNPKPVKLKFEKVYMGSVLMAKKRYVGFKYEHPDETEPVFDAKGIETIRRDGFPAQQKIEEVCLKMLFRSQDLSQVKDFCRQEWTKILQGRVSIQDFIVAKEVRLGSYSEKGVPPPGAAVAYRRILKDPRDEPQYAERVPYLISNADGRRLIDRARMPEEMLANRSLGIDAEYYIRNLLIPPLSRIFNLVGADVENWYDSMPRTKRAGKYDDASKGAGKMRIDSHFRSSHCIVCGGESSEEICTDCLSNPSTTAHTLLSRDHLAQSRLRTLHEICASCSSTPIHERILCDSIDCPITYERSKAQRDVEDLNGVREIVRRLDEVGEGQGQGRGEGEGEESEVSEDGMDFRWAKDW